MTLNVQEFLWRSSSELPPLGCHEVHVWRTRLDLPASKIQTLEVTLAADERQRASQFRFPTDRARFIVTRGILRALLGQYLGKEPQTVQFTYNEYGKPALVEESKSASIFFNMTHSKNMALYAITHIGDIASTSNRTPQRDRITRTLPRISFRRQRWRSCAAFLERGDKKHF